MKKLLQKLAIAALLVAPLVAVPVLAHEGEDDGDTPVSSDTRTTDAKNTSDSANAARMAALAERKEGRLTDAKKAVCEKRVERITAKMSKAAERGTRLLGVFGNAMTRLEEFYVKKELSVATYDDLKAAVAIKKAAAEAAIEAVKAEIDFDCSGDNPIGKVNAFNGKVRAMHTALKDYRSAIRDVLKAIKPAAEAKEDES